jgi:hypothetical protein
MKKYLDFINESKLQLLLEAKMFYTLNFMEILDRIDHPIAEEIKKLRGNEVDVNTNMIDIDYDKNDFISFIPDDKFEKMEYIVTDPSYANYVLSIGIDDKGYNMGRVRTPSEGEIVTIVKDFTPQEINSILGDTTIDKNYSHVRWNNSLVGTCECLYETDHLTKNRENVKPSPYKIGRFVNALLTKAGVKFTAKDVEAFVDKFKAEMMKRRNIFDTNFEIVKGEDIRTYYLEDNYYDNEEGTLAGSCMKGDDCQEYLNIYVENDDVVSLIIFRSEHDRELITGRALLWDARLKSNDKSIKFMDRVYVNKSNDIELFKQFAIKNGYYYKHKQDYSETPLMFNDQVLSEYDSKIYVDVNPGNYRVYPYMDTVKYHIINDGLLKNYEPGVKRDSTDGECSYCNSTGVASCNECYGDGRYQCYECDGDGTTGCSSCDGDGYIYCDNCSGEGNYDCNDCDGSGEIECSTCDGNGEDEDGNSCSDCDGRGNIECSTCDGRGSVDCEECNNGNVPCGRCDGDGSSECGQCDGAGDFECETCEGTGQRECSECQ